jgi:hypothetical protein
MGVCWFNDDAADDPDSSSIGERFNGEAGLGVTNDTGDLGTTCCTSSDSRRTLREGRLWLR